MMRDAEWESEMSCYRSSPPEVADSVLARLRQDRAELQQQLAAERENLDRCWEHRRAAEQSLRVTQDSLIDVGDELRATRQALAAARQLYEDERRQRHEAITMTAQTVASAAAERDARQKAEAALTEALRDNRLAEGAATEMAKCGREEREARGKAEARVAELETRVIVASRDARQCVADLAKALERAEQAEAEAWELHEALNDCSRIANACGERSWDALRYRLDKALFAPNPGAELLEDARAITRGLATIIELWRGHVTDPDGSFDWCGHCPLGAAMAQADVALARGKARRWGRAEEAKGEPGP